MPFPGYETLYKETTFAEISKGNRIITKNASEIAQIIAKIAGSAASPYKTIVLDDLNYISQDHFMKNALKGGWDTPKQIGYNMGLIFDEIEKVPKNKNVIVLAHYEEYKDKSGDSMSYRYKSTGNMVDNYITPEGKFEVVLFGKTSFDEVERIAVKQYVTNPDGQFPAKCPFGLFDRKTELYILNDLGLVVKKIDEFRAKGANLAPIVSAPSGTLL